MKFLLASLACRKDLPKIKSGKYSSLEVVFLRLTSSTIFSLFISSVAIATPNLHFIKASKAAETPFLLDHSSIDYKYGRDINSLFSELEKNKLSKHSLEKLSVYQKKTHSFSVLDPIYDRLKAVSSIRDHNSFFSNCSISPKKLNSYTESITDRFNISIDRHCRYLFLKRLSDLPKDINFSTRDLNYFKDATPYLATGENQQLLIELLQRLKSNKSEHAKVSNLLIDKYIEFKIKPYSLVLRNLKVSSSFNKFLQNNLSLDNNASSYFQDEFQRLSKEAQASAEKGDPKATISLINTTINFYKKNKSFISSNKAWTAAILTAKALFYKGKDESAVEVFNLAKTIAGNEDLSESHFYLIWPYIINKDHKTMLSVIHKNNLIKQISTFDSKLQYWISWAILKNGDPKKATELFNQIIVNTPYSFYSILSLKQLALLSKANGDDTNILSKLVSQNEPAHFSMDTISYSLKDSLRRFSVWSKLGNERFATLELRFIQSLSKDETFLGTDFPNKITPQEHREFITINLMRLLHSQKRYLTSFKIFQDSLDQNSLSLNFKLIRYIFPLSYLDIVKKKTDTLDPLIVLSLIRQESAFNPMARSGVGARGLMQLMPATARRFNRRVRINHLNNPEINLTIGIKYLRQLVTRFDGNLIFALASYNAGENRIDRWRKDIFRSDDPLSIIESIPYEETRNYVKLIYRNNFFYSILANKPALMIPLEETFKISESDKS